MLHISVMRVTRVLRSGISADTATATHSCRARSPLGHAVMISRTANSPSSEHDVEQSTLSRQLSRIHRQVVSTVPSPTAARMLNEVDHIISNNHGERAAALGDRTTNFRLPSIDGDVV